MKIFFSMVLISKNMTNLTSKENQINPWRLHIGTLCFWKLLSLITFIPRLLDTEDLVIKISRIIDFEI